MIHSALVWLPVHSVAKPQGRWWIWPEQCQYFFNWLAFFEDKSDHILDLIWCSVLLILISEHTFPISVHVVSVQCEYGGIPTRPFPPTAGPCITLTNPCGIVYAPLTVMKNLKLWSWTILYFTFMQSLVLNHNDFSCAKTVALTWIEWRHGESICFSRGWIAGRML